jgi:hypothetical protein
VPRGGKREGAGRPAGLPSVKTKRRIEAVEKALADGIDPLNVMLDNMRHFHKLALSAEGVLSELSAEAVKNMKPEEQFKHVIADVKKAAGFREASQNCARDAAPYCHSKLSTIEHSGKDGGPIAFERIERVIVEHTPLATTRPRRQN